MYINQVALSLITAVHESIYCIKILVIEGGEGNAEIPLGKEMSQVIVAVHHRRSTV